MAPFVPMMLRGTRVLAKCDEQGKPIVESGRVEIRYKPKDARLYQAAARNLEPIAGAAMVPDDAVVTGQDAKVESTKASSGRSAAAKKAAKAAHPHPVHDPSAIIVYADGACSGNPGPAGLGIVLLDGAVRRELSEYLGHGTNNIAELTAVKRALEAVDDPTRALHVHTDSSYAIGVLSKGWKAKANVELIASIRNQLKAFTNLSFVYVPGHAGVPLNERADALARMAVEQRASSGWLTAAND